MKKVNKIQKYILKLLSSPINIIVIIPLAILGVVILRAFLLSKKLHIKVESLELARKVIKNKRN